MNKKIIELLQDFADEKEIVMPKYIRYWDRIGHKDEVMLVCKENIIDKLDNCKIDLNDEVEILEDNTEEIEELFIDKNGFIKTNNGTWKGRKLDVAFADKINELINIVNQLTSNLPNIDK